MDYEEKADALLEAIDRFDTGSAVEVLEEWRFWHGFREHIIDDAIAAGDVVAPDDEFVPDHAVKTIRAAIGKLQWNDSGDVIAEMLGELIGDSPISPSLTRKTRNSA